LVGFVGGFWWAGDTAGWHVYGERGGVVSEGRVAAAAATNTKRRDKSARQTTPSKQSGADPLRKRKRNSRAAMPTSCRRSMGSNSSTKSSSSAAATASAGASLLFVCLFVCLLFWWWVFRGQRRRRERERASDRWAKNEQQPLLSLCSPQKNSLLQRDLGLERGHDGCQLWGGGARGAAAREARGHEKKRGKTRKRQLQLFFASLQLFASGMLLVCVCVRV
jgi:hypothetical protein